MQPSLSPVQALQRAEQLQASGDVSGAEQLLNRIVQAEPTFHPAWHALGLLAYSVGKLDMAVRFIEQAITHDDKTAIYHRNAGELYRRLGQVDDAIKHGKAACKLAKDDLDAFYNLGLAYADAADLPNAIKHYRRAIRIDHKHGLSWNNLGSVLEKTGDKREAEKAYRQAAELNPQHAEAQNNLGAILSERGELDGARECFNRAIAASPGFVEAHYNLSSLKTYTEDDPHLASLEAVLKDQQQLSDHARIRYNFAVGKALDDVEQYDRAFQAYAEGNRLQHRLLPYDETAAERSVRKIQELFDRKAMSRIPDAGDMARVPVFIVGMPRSGTTLIEQVLSSHAGLHGAGELSDLNDLIQDATSAAYPRFIDALEDWSDQDYESLGDQYLKRVWRHAPEARYISDKMPANFFYIGVIVQALPQARIIHAMRDPMDSCFSCFARLFNDSMTFAYDQGTLGRYYDRYMRLMTHWHEVLPPGRILDVRYEDMVSDFETQARRIVDYVGMPWSDDCLKFYENKRPVKTASITQVRRPIYATSVARWKHFEKHLGPLYQIVNRWRDSDAPSGPILQPDLPEATAVTDENPPTQTAETFEEALQRGIHLQNDNEHDKALEIFYSLKLQQPGNPVVNHCIGISCYQTGRIYQAIDAFQTTLAERPNYANGLNSLGLAWRDINRFDESRACFEKALQLQPDLAIARLNLGFVQLRQGEWSEGWRNYESRWVGSTEATQGNYQKQPCPLPQWTGQVGTQQDRLIVFTEQGFGDAFQFGRFLLTALEHFAGVTFVCSVQTYRSFEWSMGDRVEILNRLPTDYSRWQWHCPLMSLPYALRLLPADLPKETGYLRAQDDQVRYWRDRLAWETGHRPAIGIAWTGRGSYLYNHRRRLQFEQIRPLLGDTRFSWVSLQKWTDPSERIDVPAGTHWLDWSNELQDFADAAALISALDLVISIDSVHVHLAGGIGTPVWMLDRFDSEWRWMGQDHRSAWYPNLRIFRQPTFGDWDGVIERAVRALSELDARPVMRERPDVPPTKVTKQTGEAPQRKDSESALEHELLHATQLQAMNRLQESDQVLRDILQHDPKQALALHLLGVNAHQAGETEQAIRLVKQAISQDGSVALFHANLAEMYRQAGQLEHAVTHGERAVELDPLLANAHCNLGIARYDLGHFDKARDCQQRVLEIDPDNSNALNNLGSIAKQEKDHQRAIHFYQRAIDIDPDNPEPRNNLGAVLVLEDRCEAAIDCLEKTLQLAPDFADAHGNMGFALVRLDRFDDAETRFRKVLALKADDAKAHLGLGRINQERQRYPEAEQLILKAIELDSSNAEAHTALGTLYTLMSEQTRAFEAYENALSVEPTHLPALVGKGNLYMELGETEAAETCLNSALEGSLKEQLPARFHLCQLKKTEPGDSNLDALLEAEQGIEALTRSQAQYLQFALGKAHDDLGDPDRAMRHYLAGCAMKRHTLNYDPDKMDRMFDRIIETFSTAFIDELKPCANPSPRPIFVLGMPRSGTTLTEQIIASHPNVYGAGELADFFNIINAQLDGGESGTDGFPNNILHASKQTLAQWANHYVDRLDRYNDSAPHVTDKMPANFLLLGLIHAILPNAKIIHVRRNPVDTCVSCFTRLFQQGQEFTYDLEELARYYKNYERLMAHWQHVLPDDAFYTSVYEELVGQTEDKARRLIDYCGLDWDDRCLAFYELKRQVRTASFTQVRQPIYYSSVERWRKYAPHLGPLLNQLGISADSGA